MSEHNANATDDGHAVEGETTAGGPVDTPAAAQDTSRAVAVQPRQRLVATSDVALWDTAAFEHMGRVGAVMALAGLASETFYKDGEKEAHPDTVKARMVMVANLARECGASPLMFLQGCSIIGRKLHLEGKVVSAIITARTGIKLRYRFGAWDTDHIVFPPMIPDPDAEFAEVGEEPRMIPDPAFFHGLGERLAVRAYDPQDPERFVDGSVGLWKTDKKNSPWTSQGNYRRQLRYRAAPEWARAYEPGAVLGFYIEGEDTEDAPAGPPASRKVDLAGKLTPGATLNGEHGPEGFDRDHVARETGEAGAVDAEFEDAKDAAAETTQTTEDPRTGAAGSSNVVEGWAAPGEVYMHATESTRTDAGRFRTFKDGDHFSTVGPAKCADLKTYARHSPKIDADGVVTSHDQGVAAAEEADEADGLDQPCDICGAAAGEACLPTCTAGEEDDEDDAAEPAGEAVNDPPTSPVESTEMACAQLADDPPATSEPATTASNDGPENSASGPSAAAAENSDEPDPNTFLGRIRKMTVWDDIKRAYGEMMRDTDWMQASEADKDEVKRRIWAEVVRVGGVDHGEDVTAFGLWMATQPKTREGSDAVQGTFRALQGGTPWKERLTDDGRSRMSAKVAEFVKGCTR